MYSYHTRTSAVHFSTDLGSLQTQKRSAVEWVDLAHLAVSPIHMLWAIGQMCISYSVTDPHATGNRFRCAFSIVSPIHMLRGLGSDVHLL